MNKDEDPIFDNTVGGVVKSINYVVNKYMPDAYNGWQFNTWGYSATGVPSIGLMHATETMGMEKGKEFIKNAAKVTAEYYLEAGVTSYNTEFISIDKYGLDGAYERANEENSAGNNPKDSMWFWNADLWNNYLDYVKVLGDTCEKPVILWQIPVGRLNSSKENNPYNNGTFKDLANVDQQYEDSSTSFFLGDTFTPGTEKRNKYFSTNDLNDPKVSSNGNTVTWKNHMEEAKASGIISILFGAGVGKSTDGVGSPPTDDYWWITKVQRYLKNPVMLEKKEVLQGDVNEDGKVDIFDLAIVSKKYNTTVKDNLYDIKCDLNNDGIIDIYDLVVISKKI